MAVIQSSLNVIALVSGGKDSFFALLHCLANGHRVIALANLFPPSSSHLKETEDLNSFMYQTAGHELISLYSEALNLPLYREEIVGRAQDESKDYSPVLDPGTIGPVQVGNGQETDEVECLMPLLQKVIAAHPTANAVCSGAILSTYQRTRIESVALRLNLTSLCFLWQYPSLPPPSSNGLLDDMAAVGFDVRIIKVASGGLDENFLWNNLMENAVRQRLNRAMSKFGGSILGEGGEYETLVLSGPNDVWDGSIKVNPHTRTTRRGSSGEAWIEFQKSSGGVQKESMIDQSAGHEMRSKVRIPDLYDQHFRGLLHDLGQNAYRLDASTIERKTGSSQREWAPRTSLIYTSSSIKLWNMTAVNAGTTASDQMSALKAELLNLLTRELHLSSQNVVFTTILLRSMTDFSTVNEIYRQIFTHPTPAARVTVACGDMLPLRVQLMLSFVISREVRREGLHVQSRSYWAPANIGPYSQAISIPFDNGIRMTYVAGQIPLVPASMEILQTPSDHVMQSFKEQACLALQHLWRIGTVMRVGWWTNVVAFLAGDGDIEAKAILAWEAWKQVHDPRLWAGEEEGVAGDNIDVWDLVHGGQGSLNLQQASSCLPDFLRLPGAMQDAIPGFLAVQVDELPRACDIEWQSSGLEFQNDHITVITNIVSHTYIESDQTMRALLKEVLNLKQDTEGVDVTIYTPRPDLVDDFDVQVIPCRALWGPAGLRLAAGVLIRKSTCS